MEQQEYLPYIFNHVFLPPRLPQKDDDDDDASSALVEAFEESLRYFRSFCDPTKCQSIERCISMLHKLEQCQKTKDPKVLAECMRSLAAGDYLVLHVKAQNAAFLAERRQNCFRFISFELAASSQSVVECRGRLKRFFPGPAVDVPQRRVLDTDFIDELAEKLHQLDRDSLSEAAPKMHKAKSDFDEKRDTVHPMFVTEMVMATLRAVGEVTEVKRFEKNVREDVLWDDALLPWRRSPLWLLLRASTQMYLGEAYKPLMIVFMSRLIQRAVYNEWPSEDVHVMCAKLLRRLKKAEPDEHISWLLPVQERVLDAHRLLNTRWTLLQQLPKPLGIECHPSFRYGCLPESLRLTMHGLQQYLQQRDSEETAIRPTAYAPCESYPRSQRHCIDLPDLPPDPNCTTALRLWVVDIEYWVEASLDSWKLTLFRAHHHRIALSDQVFARFADLINRYKGVVDEIGPDHPEQYSIASLTLIEMWRALDEMALSDCSILRDYDPGFSPKLFEPLLLRSRPQLKRLGRIKDYVRRRQAQATYKRFHIFTSIKQDSSFSVRFYDTSALHQTLRQKIEQDAHAERASKIEELAQLQRSYRDLIEAAARLNCEYVTAKKRRRDWSYHSPHCRKCAQERQAQVMRIDIHEWPLPVSSIETKAFVFELDVPSGFVEWRDFTFGLLVDTFSTQGSSAIEPENIYGFQQLQSTTKPFCVSHLKNVLVSTAVTESVCPNHGASYEAYDDKNSCFILESDIVPDIQKSCAFQLPAGPYRSLQFAVTGTSHTSNEAIARKSQCPSDIDLQEFYSFSTLRAGHRIQLHNIARELVGVKLNFDREETYLLIAQALWQAGPSTTDGHYHESHMALEAEDFGQDLLAALDFFLESRKGSWQNAAAVRILSVICRRLLSLAVDEDIQKRCLELLSDIRATAILWLRTMSRRVYSADQEHARHEHSLQTLDVALICYETFDVDEILLQPLFAVQSNIFTATKCAMHIHDLVPADPTGLPPATRRLFLRWQRLAINIEDELRAAISSCSYGLNDAVKELWDGYHAGQLWEIHDGSWISTNTSAESGRQAAIVHFNLLSGALLVDGHPISRLPKTYENHVTYKRLFGKMPIEVVPSTLPGMKFQACRETNGSRVHFDMRGTELIVRVERSGREIEVIPITALTGQLPESFVRDYVYWLDLATNNIDLQPLEEVWTESPNPWKMKMVDGFHSMRQGNSKLVDIQSSLARAVYTTLAPLEHSSSIHIFSDGIDEQVTIRLHRFNLDFELTLSPPRMHSKQYRGMFVDEIQSVGTFTGLANKLILRDMDGSRMLIVPYGTVRFSRNGDHVCVEIDNGPHEQVRHYAYHVDPHLERIRGDGSLRSKLYQTYLHALTSHCLPDELTGRTGTEESLELLRGAWIRSFPHFEEEDVCLLQSIARLTPRMLYYPKHLHVMQQIQWSNLPVLSQHCEFVERVRDTVRHATSLGVFRSDTAALEMIQTGFPQPLRDRMAARQAPYRVEDFGAEAHNPDFDVIYSPRERIGDTARVSRVVKIAMLVDSWSTDLRPSQGLPDIMSQWTGHVGGVGSEESPLDLVRDLDWLKTQNTMVPPIFGQLLTRFASAHPIRDKNKVMFFLSMLAFAKDASESLCSTLLAFATVPQLRAMQFPRYAVFTVKDGLAPNRGHLTSIAQDELRELEKCPEHSLHRNNGESDSSYEDRQLKLYDASCLSKVDSFVSQLTSQWPTSKISSPPSDIGTYINLDSALKRARPLFLSWFRNRQLHRFVEKARDTLSSLSASSLQPESYAFALPATSNFLQCSYVRFEDFTARPAPVLTPASPSLQLNASTEPSNRKAQAKLRQFLTGLTASHDCSYEQDYVKDLIISLHAYEDIRGNVSESTTVSEQVLRQHLDKCRNYALDYRRSLQRRPSEGNKPSDNLAAKLRMVPRTSTMSLLGRLSSMRIGQLASDWKACLVRFGQALSAVQHAERLLRCRNSPTDLAIELHHQAHSGWDSTARPDWLLFELESNIRIRAKQAQIADEMISPRTERNSVLQLNMGEGKSSVITPIVAAALADGTKLVRIVVLKQLSAQMHRILANSLGGMLNRPVIQMPFSRSMKLSVDHALSIQPAYQACMRAGGVVLLQPEHIASFELMVHDTYLRENAALAQCLWSTRRWIHDNTRDVLDESDEILSTRFELVYTTGLQRALEFAPQRWQITQRILKIIAEHIPWFANQNKSAFILENCQRGGFPRMRIVDEKIGSDFLDAILRGICQQGMHGLPVSHLNASQKAALERYLSEPVTGSDVMESIACLLDNDELKNTLLTLRGLFAFGVLLFSFQRKRWRVDYGLDPSRTLLAVPFRAKDAPELRSEFSHPEVIIVLTCLSYYYGGLTDKQLGQCFETLAAQDDAEDEYTLWVQDADALPMEFRSLAGVNWQDSSERMLKLHPCFRLAKSVVDFFVTNHVFRYQLREFPDKLAASGWNIAKEKAHLTTGFSGTCDSKHVLPSSITQDNLPGQLHTNASVLGCLLAPRNEVWPLTAASLGQGVSADLLLKKILSAKQSIRVIIDVGAQILEWTNVETARTWLSHVPKADVDAAVFFDDKDEIVVLDRADRIELLATSSFASRLDRCVVYLDEVHTRGTDLKLPTTFRAAVTLSPGLTKDRLVQACMRMRKLDRGQSVVFLLPPEVQRKILYFLMKPSVLERFFEMSEVLKWCISQTWTQIKRDVGRWSSQGLRYARHENALAAKGAEPWDKSDVEQHICEPDSKNLEQLYGVDLGVPTGRPGTDPHCEFKSRITSSKAAIDHYFGIGNRHTAMLEEEQERELSPEIQQLRLVELPPDMDPSVHRLHPDVGILIRQGFLTLASNAFLPAFNLFGRTSAGRHLEKAWAANLLMTRDFADTVSKLKSDNGDFFLRPVHWIARHSRGGLTSFVVLSPYEVNEVLAFQHRSDSVSIHVYSARTSEYNAATDGLTFCTINRAAAAAIGPSANLSLRLLQLQLNLFAGQTILSSHAEYISLCQFLGLLYSIPTADITVSIDGYLGPAVRRIYDELMAEVCPFQENPLSLLSSVLGMRRDGKAFDKSHLGRLLHGEVLRKATLDDSQHGIPSF